jgi:hypothetical protein
MVVVKFGKKMVLSSLLVSSLALPSIAAAYSGSYSFDIRSSVTGSTEHSLKAAIAKTTVKANTYNSSGSVQSSKSDYQVNISKFLKAYAVSGIPANGSSYTKSFGTISSGDYVVSVFKSDSTGYSIKGSGTINQ